MPNYQQKLRQSRYASLTGATKLFTNLIDKLESQNADGEWTDAITILKRGEIPSEDLEQGQGSAQEETLLTQTDLSRTIAAYDNYCTRLLADFNDILEAYTATGHHSFNRYIANQAYYHPFMTVEAQAFVTVIDAISLIDPAGTWLKALKTQVNSLNTFNFNQQQGLLDNFYTFFEGVKIAQEQAIQKNFSDIKEQLSNFYTVDQTLNGRDTLLSDSIPLMNDIEANTDASDIDPELIDRTFKNTATEADKNYLASNPKLATDLQYFTQQWQQQGIQADQGLKNLKKKIHHFAQSLGLPNHISKQVSTDETLLWHSAYQLNTDGTTLISSDKQTQRLLRTRHQNIAWFSALFLGFGEGLVAVYGFNGRTKFSLLNLTIADVIVGLAGWHINYALFKGDIRACLSDFFMIKAIEDKKYRRLFIGTNNQAIDDWQKVSAYFGSGACGFVGLVFAALSFFSTQSQLDSYGTKAIGNNPAYITSVVMAAALAIGVFIGFTSIYFRSITNLIKNNDLGQLCVFMSNLHHPALAQMESHEKNAHYFLSSAKILMMSVAIGLTLTTFYFSYPLLHKDSQDLLMSTKTDEVTADSLAISAVCVYFVVAIPFQVMGPYFVLNDALARRIETHQHFMTLDTNQSESLALTAMQQDNQNVQKIRIITALVAAMINGAAQGFLYSDNSTQALLITSVIVGWAFSFFPNISNVKAGIVQDHQHLTLTNELVAPNLALDRPTYTTNRWISLTSLEIETLTVNPAP